jgi:hypothetical protein
MAADQAVVTNKKAGGPVYFLLPHVGFPGLAGLGMKGGTMREIRQVHHPHGFFKGKSRPTDLYRLWADMRRRCKNEKHASWKNYGGRGISVCDEWGNFSIFHSWAMANGYRKGLLIDRKNNDGNYEPSNCRWVTRKIQNNNKRNNILFTHDGVTLTLQAWADLLLMPKQTLQTRRRLGWSIEKILTTPVKTRPRKAGSYA